MRMAVMIGGLVGIAATAHAALDWKQLPTLPDREGFAGSYAGVTGGALLVAGGANFPGKPPWEGGTKVWYDRAFVLESNATAWREGGKLPAAGGYGVSVQLEEGVLLIGGGDAKRNFSEVWLARWDGSEAKFTAWPSLPRPLAMAAGVRVGRTVFVAGGLDRPDATQAQKIFLSLDLDTVKAGWRELAPWPGPERMLATAGAHDGSFFLFSGARLVADAQGKVTREWLRDAYRYTPGAGWKPVADLPRVAVAAPSPAPSVGGKLLVIGGDDGGQASVAPTEHKGFPRDVLAYDPVANAWSRAGEVPFSLVTTTLALWREKIVIPGGEQRPGVRSPAVWAAEMK
ncbi:MAG: galactose oxidase [Opitutus sp.]|nr:galactose oxidase [Opitutus sp.]